MSDTENIIKSLAFPKDLADKVESESNRLGLSFNAFIRLATQSYFEEIKFERKDKEGGANGNTR